MVQVEDLYLPNSRQALRHSLDLEFSHDYGISPLPESHQRCMSRRVNSASGAVVLRCRAALWHTEGALRPRVH